MAGSYKHCTKKDGSFVASEDFTSMIENLSDAYEACEMMHFMIGFLASKDADRIQEAEEAFFASKRPPLPDWWHKLHDLWTKAASLPGYDKREWANFETLITKATQKP